MSAFQTAIVAIVTEGDAALDAVLAEGEGLSDAEFEARLAATLAHHTARIDAGAAAHRLSRLEAAIVSDIQHQACAWGSWTSGGTAGRVAADLGLDADDVFPIVRKLAASADHWFAFHGTCADSKPLR